MEFRILGPLEVPSMDEAKLGGRQPRTALAVLLLYANEVVAAERLARVLWGEDAPGHSSKSVQVLISRLRKALDTPDRIVTRPSGYLLSVGPDELDAARFEQLAAEGERALAAGWTARAARLLRDALRLWRGTALAELEFHADIQLRLARLEERRLEVHEACAKAELAEGMHATLVGDLEKLVRENPTRERLAADLMLALYRCGRQPDALAVYRELQKRLDEEFGVKPGAALIALEKQILDQAPELDLPQRAGRSDAVPLPVALRRRATTPYVGRTRERSALREVVDRACASSRQVLLIGGDAGVGKTRLAGQTALAAHEAGFTVTWGMSAEHLSAPYSTWIGALSHLVEHASDAVLAAHVAEHGGALSRLVRALELRAPHAPPAERIDPETERYVLFAAVAGFLSASCAEGPVALVLDDLQWADPQSLDLLRHVVWATSPDLPLLLLGTYRDADLPRDHPLRAVLADLHRVDDRGLARMELGGLSPGEVTELMTSVAGHDIGAGGRALAAEIADETDGNPFFVGQMLQHLRESGAVEQDDLGHWRVRVPIAELGLPRNVREVIARRVQRLGDDTVAMLTMAAVLGRRFDLRLLERLVDLEPDALQAAVDAAVDGAVLVEPAPGELAFSHALINHSITCDLTESRRSRMHVRVATVLEQLPGDWLADLAHHWNSVTDPAYRANAVRYARLAGARALQQLAPDDAIRWFTTALAKCEDEAERCDLLTGLGEAQRQLGGPFRETLLDASALAERLGDVDRLTRAVLANTLGPFGAAGPRDDRRVAALDRALAAAPHDAPRRPRMLAILGKELYFSGAPAKGLELADEALTLARRRGDRRELGRVMALTTSISKVTPLHEHAALVRELTTLAEEFDDRELRFRAANARFIFAMHSGDVAELDAALDEMRRLADAVRQPLLRWTAQWTGSARCAIAGRLDEAEQLTEDAHALAERHGLPHGGVITFGQRLSIRTEQDRLEELADPAAQIAARYPDIPMLRLTCAFIAAETGRDEDARPVLSRLAKDGFDFQFDRTRAFNLARCADIAVRLRDPAHARTLYDELLEYGDQFASPGGISSRGSIQLSLGRLAALDGRPDDAARHLKAAERAHQRMNAPLLLARTWLADGDLLRATDPVAAAERLRLAYKLARGRSAALERETSALLAADAPAAMVGNPL